MEPAHHGGSWNTWDGLDEANASRVTSQPLSARHRVQSRWFPKVRSWFALGAPLELLSPLSVLRVFLPFAATGAVVTAVWRAAARSTPPTVAVAVAALIVLVASVVPARPRATRRTEIYALSAVVATALVAHDTTLVAAVWGSAVGVVASIVLGLFARARAIFTAQAVMAAALAALWIGNADGAASAGAAAIASMVCCMVASSVWFVARSARRQGEIDADTGLPNGFGLARRFAADDGGRATLLVAVVEVGGLANVRDALGYQAATELLRRVVEDLGQVVPARSVIGRVSGDELVVICAEPARGAAESSGLPDQVEASLVAFGDNLASALRQGRYVVGEIELVVRPHIGLAAAPWHGRSLTEVVRCASLSASRAAAAGATLVRWNGDDSSLTSQDLVLLADLRVAIERHELSLAYQPQVGAATGAVVAVEALVRWRSTVHGDVSPARFVGLAERTGLIDRLTEWILHEALAAQVRWRVRGWCFPTAVNVSGLTISRPDLAEWVSAALDAHALPGTALVLELTETAPTPDLLQAIAQLEPLHQRGVRVAIDDFGTGYTSLAALSALKVDELKIDQSFVRRSITSPSDGAIVRAMCDLAHRLGMRAVAEGVEDDALYKLMVSFGIDVLQGYRFAKPLAEAALVEFLDAAGNPAQPPQAHRVSEASAFPVGVDVPDAMAAAARWVRSASLEP